MTGSLPPGTAMVLTDSGAYVEQVLRHCPRNSNIFAADTRIWARIRCGLQQAGVGEGVREFGGTTTRSYGTNTSRGMDLGSDGDKRSKSFPTRPAFGTIVEADLADLVEHRLVADLQ